MYLAETEDFRSIFVLISICFLMVVLAASSYIFLRGRRSFFLSCFLASGISLAVWLIALILKINAPDQTAFWLLVSLQHLAIFSCCFFLLLTGISSYTGQDMPLRVIVLLSLPFSVSFLLVVTNPMHDAFFDVLELLEQQPGNLYYPVLALNFIFALIGLVLCCISISNSGIAVLNRIILFSGTLIPAITAAAATGEIFRFSSYFAPVPLIVSLLVCGFIGLKHRFFAIMPLAGHFIMNEINSALIILRDDGRIIDYNQAFSGIFAQTVITANMQIGDLEPQLACQHWESLAQTGEISLDTAQGKRLFEISIQPIVSRHGKKSGKILRLIPLDQEQELRRLLFRQNEQLEIANREMERYMKIVSELRGMMVRNSLAREMHDSLGHTLIILISVLERLISTSADEPQYQELVREACTLVSRAAGQLPPAGQTDAESQQTGADPAAQSLAAMLDELGRDLNPGGVRLEKELRGEIGRIPADHYRQLRQICREAVTNAIKHGSADIINIFFLVGESSYDLIILDNGAGSDDISIGFGLRNMRERIESLGGSLRIQGDSSGFGVYAAIPLPRPTGSDDS